VAALAAVAAGCIGTFRATPVLESRACGALLEGAGRVVAWYVPADAGDGRALEAWCVGVGPVVLDTVPDEDGWVAGGDSLRILVWNVSAGGGDLEGFLEREAGLSCASPGGPAPPFVLMAQEVYRRSDQVPRATAGTMVSLPAVERSRPGAREDVTVIARRCGLALFYVPAVRNGGEEFPDGREDRGNALLANVALHDPIAIELPAEDSRRLAIGATVRGPAGDSVRLVTMHFTLLPKLWRNLTTGNAARVRQALGMLDALSQVESARGPAGGIATVVAGDANVWSHNDAALRRLREAFPDSPEAVPGGTRGPFPADHLLFRRATGDATAGSIVPGSYRHLASEYNSDHRPLGASYRFAP
jgi:endonuclease/exonuclease/phosphatase family metal-dependent hydrolase